VVVQRDGKYKWLLTKYGIKFCWCNRPQISYFLLNRICSRLSTITPVMRELHWLPVRQRAKFKIAVLVYKSLHGLTASYLTDDCQLVANSGRHKLWLADVDTCIIPRMNNWLSDRSFAVDGPRIWDTLRAELPQPDTELVTFRWLLKTHSFKCDPGPRRIVASVLIAPYKYSTVTTTTECILSATSYSYSRKQLDCATRARAVAMSWYR